MTDGELAELLRSVIARPDDLDVLRVYADVLIERGDARGELIAVQLERRAQDSPALVAREGELAAALDTALVAQLGQPGTAFSWRRGFLEAIDFTPGGERRALADSLRQLGTMPLARQLRRIVIRLVEPGWGSMGPITSMLAKVAPQLRGLRELVFTMSPRGEGVAKEPSQIGELSPVCRAIPRLEVLELAAADFATLRDAELPSLKRLVLEEPRRFCLQALGRVQLPSLEELEIYEGSWVVADIEELFGRTWPVRSLVIQTHNGHLLQDLVRAVPASRLFERVRVFELRGAPLDIPAIDQLLLHAPRLRKLKHFAVEPTTGFRRLADALGDIVVAR
jgi:uncharacterized protein (TIGR02996 family)